ncbi:hypothetical protein WA026_004323 [Henosepilachna vigintioctopunctata]|uniref:Reverse transcriptase domain-containing protein n=1 Tax=Henosepilachna vigintioctopunctata TaxID=420089 RepID=A0AAW1V8H8_9CUCU
MSTGVALFDVSKAFDRVWHEGLLFKLFEAGIPKAMVQLIASYQQQRHFRVRVGISHSTDRIMEAGLPQGSVLSPMLYNLFTRDVPKSQDTNLALYADDTAIFTRSWSPHIATQRLQQAVDNLQEWFTTWCISVNSEKSQALFLSKRRHRPDEEIHLNGTPIPWTDKAKYLGVIVDRRLTWKSHIDYCTARAKAVQSQLYPLINRRSKLSAATKIRIYKAIILPTMSYASPVWGYAAKTHINKLQVVQNKSLRMAIDAPWYVRTSQIHRDLGMPSVLEIIRATAAKMFAALPTNPNPLVANLGDYEEDANWKHKRPKLVLREDQD